MNVSNITFGWKRKKRKGKFQHLLNNLYLSTSNSVHFLVFSHI